MNRKFDLQPNTHASRQEVTRYPLATAQNITKCTTSPGGAADTNLDHRHNPHDNTNKLGVVVVGESGGGKKTFTSKL